MDIFTEFILSHSNDDPAELLLGKSKWPDIDVGLAVNTIACRKKLKDKAPEWFAHPELRFPLTVSAEQCSSSATATYKAALCGKILSGGKIPAEVRRSIIADLTGGMGIDSYAFSSISSRVLYNEMNRELAEAARFNFRQLGRDNIEVSSEEIRPGAIANLLKVNDFKEPGIIFLDPSRRSDSGRKVFKIEDCRPDIAGLQDELLSESQDILVKLSPMADIGIITRKLKSIRQIHIVSLDGECKEVLVLMHRGPDEGCKIIACELKGDFKASDAPATFEFKQEEEKEASAEAFSNCSEMELIQKEGAFLFEPGKALMKTGAFKLISSRFSLVKLGVSTHLYICPATKSEEEKRNLKSLGKLFRIIDSEQLCKSSLKAAGAKWPHSEVTARNIPLTSDELRKKMKVSSGDDAHIFGVKIDFTEDRSSNFLIVTTRSTD
ncbi:MAG: hypothetical protein WCR48_06085 [Bacteroidales bacterium]